MAAFAALGIIGCFDGMKVNPVAAVAFRFVITAEVFNRKIVSRTAAGVTIKAELLCVALITVFYRLAGNHTVSPYPVAVMVGSDTFGIVAFVAFGNFHFRVIPMVLFLRQGLLNVKGRQKQKQ